MNMSYVVNLTTYISTDNVAVEAGQLQLFRMHVSRTFFVQKAILTNPFKSQIFMWSDSDCFRDNSVIDIFNNYVGKKLIYHAEMIPRSAVLMMSTFVMCVWINRNEYKLYISTFFKTYLVHSKVLDGFSRCRNQQGNSSLDLDYTW